MNKTWIVFGNNDLCRHADALHGLGFLSWKMSPNHIFAIGDIVYLFVSDLRQIKFKLVVTEKDVPRQDTKYWKKVPSEGLTYKLELKEEYFGSLLKEDDLEAHGLKRHSLENAQYRNEALINYIDSVFGQIKTSWMISCNPEKFDVISAFNELDSVFWIQSRQMTNFRNGDIVYIYEGGNVGRIVLKCRVGDTKIPYSSKIDKDKKYWLDKHSDKTDTSNLYMELFLVDENKTNGLSLADLRQHGETSSMQGVHRLSGDYLQYIDSYFDIVPLDSNCLWIQELLKGRDVDFDKSSSIKLVRHTITSSDILKSFDGTIDDLYKKKDLFYAYQNRQQVKYFESVEYIVSFIAESGTNSRFIGVYKNNGMSPDMDGFAIFDFVEVQGFSDLKEKVVVEWGNPRSWHQWYDSKMAVIEAPENTRIDHWFQQLDLNTKDRIRHTIESDKVIEAKHQKIQEAIKPILEREGYIDVTFEEHHVDIKGRIKGNMHFFEVKTYDSAKACIREALGQILEYAHYSNPDRVDELYIVGPVGAKVEDIKYLELLRNTYRMKIYYRAYIEKANSLAPRV